MYEIFCKPNLTLFQGHQKGEASVINQTLNNLFAAHFRKLQQNININKSPIWSFFFYSREKFGLPPIFCQLSADIAKKARSTIFFLESNMLQFHSKLLL